MLLTRRWTAHGVKEASAAGNGATAGAEASSSSSKKSDSVAAAVTKESCAKKQDVSNKAKAVPTANAAVNGSVVTTNKSKKARRQAHKRHILLNSKEPEVAAAYLQAWADREDGTDGSNGNWKFNKATQAWLIRHLYDPQKVAKDTLGLLLRYLAGLRGGARDRLKTEAGAIVLLKGAPLVVPEADASSTRDKKKKRRKKDDAMKKEANVDVTEGDGPGEEEVLGAAEVKNRKIRLRRAKQVLAVLDDGAAAGDGEGGA